MIRWDPFLVAERRKKIGRQGPRNRSSVGICHDIWVNYNDLTATSLKIVVYKWKSYPLNWPYFQISELCLIYQRVFVMIFLVPMTDPWCWYIFPNIKGVY